MKRKRLAKRAFELQNEWRKTHHRRPLKWEPRCRVTAKAACLVIIRHGELRHDPRWYVGLRKALGNVEVSENIGWGQDEPLEIIQGFANSPVHREIMQDPTLTRGAYASIYSRKLRKRVWVAHYAGN